MLFIHGYDEMWNKNKRKLKEYDFPRETKLVRILKQIRPGTEFDQNVEFRF